MHRKHWRDLLSGASTRVVDQPMRSFFTATTLLAAAVGQRTHAVPSPLPEILISPTLTASWGTPPALDTAFATSSQRIESFRSLTYLRCLDGPRDLHTLSVP